MSFHVPDKYRVRSGPFGTDATDNFGAFFVPLRGQQAPLKIIASSGNETDATAYGKRWEHVSVSLPNRCPTWDEMALVKSIFWDEDDCVVQFHPPRAEYVNNHPFCLHLWRPVDEPMPMPPSILVGYKSLGVIR